MAEDLSRFHGLTRSQLMARIRSRGNKKTEVLLAQLFRANGIKGWRRHWPVSGTPDFVFRKQRVAVFVDGCFWHGCKKHFKMPTTRRKFWSSKIERNQLRDKAVAKLLRRAGWTVVRIWEHELQKRYQPVLLRKISSLLGSATNAATPRSGYRRLSH